MLISQLIEQLKDQLEKYGDSNITFRPYLCDDDFDVCTVYYDDDAEKLILGDLYYF